MIIFNGILTTGETVCHLFSSHSSLKKHTCYRQATALTQKKISFSGNAKKEKLLLQLLSQLGDNLHLSSSLAASLQFLKNNSPDLVCRAIFSDLSQTIRNGKSFFEALKKTPIAFQPSLLQLIHQGEKNHQLPKALNLVITHLEDKLAQKKEIKKKVAYPCLLSFSTLLFLHFLLLNVFPGMLSLYESLGKVAPPWLMGICHHSGFLLLADPFLVFFIALFISPITRGKIISIVSLLPLFKPLMLLAYRLQWLQNFSLSYAAGTALTLSFQRATKSCSHPILKRVFSQIEDKITQGESLARAFSHNPFIPPNWVLAFQLGEKNNNLNQLCGKLIQKEKKTLHSKINFLIGLIEPLTLLILGVVILFLVIALYAPLLGAYSAGVA